MASKEKNDAVSQSVRLNFGLSNHFDASFNKNGSTGFNSFLIKSCTGFRLLLPGSVVEKYAHYKTGLDNHYTEGLPVLPKIWAGTNTFHTTDFKPGISNFRIIGYNDASTFRHYNLLHRENSKEFLKYEKFANEYLGYDKYLESMHQQDVILNRKKLSLKSFWMVGNIELPVDFAEMLIKLVSDYPPDSVEFSCITKKTNLLRNYTENIENDNYEVSSNFIELDEESFVAHVNGGIHNHPVGKTHFLDIISRQRLSDEKKLNELSTQIAKISETNIATKTEIETKIDTFEQYMTAIRKTLRFIVIAAIITVVMVIYTIISM